MAQTHSQIGVIGLGVMGRNFVLNIADRGFAVAGYDTKPQQVQLLKTESAGLRVRACESLQDFMAVLGQPKIALMLVPAGPPVDSVLRDLLPSLSSGDIVIDAGNSYYEDTNLRAKSLAEKGIRYVGTGISGGEEGARHGPSLMPGGPEDAWRHIEPIFTAVAAKAGGKPCVAYLGPGSSGHYVKMVHNGIEYGLMQLIAETYDFMARGLKMSDLELANLYEQWNKGSSAGFLLEITSNIFRKIDEKTHQPLIDLIFDAAKQKGTGMWTSQDAMRLGIPVPIIDTAVAMRDLSCFKNLRIEESRVLGGPSPTPQADKTALIEDLSRALSMSVLLTYSQGFAVLDAAAREHDYSYSLATVASIWRGGCIIRSALLDEIMAAYTRQPRLEHLLDDATLAARAIEQQASLRNIVRTAAQWGLPMPGMMAALSYFDALRSAWLPANLIQAQRDYFGSHTYERVDEKGTFHTRWTETETETYENLSKS